jgi:hypothetical protein
MAVSANLDNVLDPEYASSTVTDLVNAPVSALSGVSDADAQGLELAFNIRTVGDLANNQFIRAALAIVEMAKVAG